MPEEDLRKQEVVLRQYDIIMAHLRFDHTLFWTRFGFLLVSQIGMLGFFQSTFAATQANLSSNALLVCVVLPLVGLVLVYLFHCISVISYSWIEHWISNLNLIEPVAFGDIKLFRDFSPPIKLGTSSARQLATRFMYLFGCLWLAALFMVIMRATCLF
jgi:hypothetical protein